MKTHPFCDAQNLLKELVSDLVAISSTIEHELSAILDIAPLPAEKKFKIIVQPKVQIYDCPPPYPITDEEFETMTPVAMKATRQHPIVFMIMLYIGDADQGQRILLYYGNTHVDKFKGRPVLNQIRAAIANPKSYLWLRLAWMATPQEVESIQDMVARDEDEPRDDADKWKPRGWRP